MLWSTSFLTYCSCVVGFMVVERIHGSFFLERRTMVNKETNHRCIFFSMAMKASKRFSVKTDVSVFKRLGNRNQENIARNHQVKTLVCKYWLQGRCTKNPCRFLHPDQANDKSKYAWKNPSSPPISKYAWKNPHTLKSENSPPIEKAQRKSSNNKESHDQNHQNQIVPKPEQKLQTIEVKDGQGTSIPKKDNGTSHSGLSMVARLEGHTKAITGIALPSGSNKLFSGSKDRSLRVWDCNSGQCGGVVDFDDECGTLVHEDPWIFAGLRDMIKGWHLNTQQEVIIRGSGGKVNSITMFEDILFAGMEDGTILSWKSTSETGFSETATSLKGHTGSVLSLVVGAKMLFSGSADRTIRVWNIESLECKYILQGHTGDVTTVLCWDQYLLSGSLDKKIKVWATTESGNIEEVYEHNPDNGVVTFCGMHDLEGKPMLLCACKDKGVGLYELPSFVEKGRVVSERDIHAIQSGPDGLFFTGDAAGLISVWKLTIIS